MARKQPRCFVIAEAGVNHNGDLRAARRLVDAARRAGADAVKFQTFKAEKLATASAALAPYQKKRLGGGAQLDMIRRLELSDGDHQRLFEHCAKAGILFLSTLSMRRARICSTVWASTLASFGSSRTRLAAPRRGKGKPLILSTGITLAEVRRAVGWIFSRRRVPLTLLHCVTEYPAPADEVNLRAMDTLREAFGLPVGYSDHTLGVEIAVAAAARGAAVIEKHLTLDRRLPGPDQAASLEPEDFRAMVAAIRLVESALGDGVKHGTCSGKPRLGVAQSGRARDLPRGHRLEAKDLLAKRPGTGIPPAEAARLLGRKLRRALRRDGLLRWDLV